MTRADNVDMLSEDNIDHTERRWLVHESRYALTAIDHSPHEIAADGPGHSRVRIQVALLPTVLAGRSMPEVGESQRGPSVPGRGQED